MKEINVPAFIEETFGCHLLLYQKELLQKLYDERRYYFILSMPSYERIYLDGLKLLSQILRKENEYGK